MLKTTFDGESLITALKKLSVPVPIFIGKQSQQLPVPPYLCFFYYSHPPLLERLRTLKS